MDLVIALDARFLHLCVQGNGSMFREMDILENEKINYDNGFLRSEKYDLKVSRYKKKFNTILENNFL